MNRMDRPYPVPESAEIEALAEKLYLAYWAPTAMVSQPVAWYSLNEYEQRRWRSVAERVREETTEIQRRDLAEMEELEVDRLRAALRDCHAEAYNGLLADHDPLASLMEISRIASKALDLDAAADYDRKTEALRDEADAARESE